MERGNDPKGKRKIEPKRKALARRGRGRTAGGSGTGRGDGGGSSDPFQDENSVQMIGRTIPPFACPSTPLHLDEYDSSYIREYTGEILLSQPNNSRTIRAVDYSKSWKITEEARQVNPYQQPKDNGIDFRFWNAFHSNFYSSVILKGKKSKIVKMQYIN